MPSFLVSPPYRCLYYFTNNEKRGLGLFWAANGFILLSMFSNTYTFEYATYCGYDTLEEG